MSSFLPWHLKQVLLFFFTSVNGAYIGKLHSFLIIAYSVWKQRLRRLRPRLLAVTVEKIQFDTFASSALVQVGSVLDMVNHRHVFCSPCIPHSVILKLHKWKAFIHTECVKSSNALNIATHMHIPLWDEQRQQHWSRVHRGTAWDNPISLLICGQSRLIICQLTQVLTHTSLADDGLAGYPF